MSQPTNLLQLFEQFSPITNGPAILEGLLRWLFLIAFGVFVVFAFVVIRQVKLMAETISTPLETALHILAWLYFLVTVFVFVFVLFTI